MKRLLLLILLMISMKSFSQSSEYVSILKSDRTKYVPMSSNWVVPASCLKFISLIAPGSPAADVKNWSKNNISGRMKFTANLFTFLFDSEGNDLEVKEVLKDSGQHSSYYDVESALADLGYFDFDNLICYQQGAKIWYEATSARGVVKLDDDMDTILE